MSTLFEHMLECILEQETKDDYRAAVAIVQHGNKWLLGLATNNDDRKNKWCHPGGGIKPGESPEKAAVREAWEETGIRCKAVGEAFPVPSRKGVAFVHCKTTSKNPKLDNNGEFSALGFFKYEELRSLKLYNNVKQLINRVR